MSSVSRLLIALELGMLLTACGSPAPIPETAAPPATESPAPASPTPNPALAAIPTEAPRSYIGYQHSTGVFALNIPDDWEVIDDSSAQRLILHFVPPAGYGSRVQVDLRYTGPITAEQISALIDESLAPLLSSGYSEIARSELADGRIEIMLDYDDGRGGRGAERVLVGVYGPYFAVSRYFLATSDEYTLRQALEAMASSFSVDALAGWGSAVAAINPAELLIVNTYQWVDEEDVLHFSGELYNAAPATIVDALLLVGFCDQNGTVLAELRQAPAVSRVTSGGRVPFAVTLSGLPEAVQVCVSTASARPEPAIPTLSTGLLISPGQASLLEEALVVDGSISNPELASLQDIVVSVAAYDVEGRVVGYASLSYGESLVLAPGASHRFQIVLSGLGGDPARYIILAQGRK